MNIRYFFIAGAITCGLALAIQESDRIVNQEKAPIVTPYTVDEVDQDDLNLLEPASGTFDTLDILVTHSNYSSRSSYEEDLYNKGKTLLDALVGFLCSVITFFVKTLFATH
ncbi:hypothetical protein ME1_00557 [Bartonella vinsonii subsp. arupensis OK-94-513]|uniref:Uncharacterized protein n=2 Tax=Bartonella vinsonii subsp. arupensis TaxID=110578 RepID=J1JUE2_BARVI|nr:hypothetical protein [Bartonella vinsonii]EJF88557.1 hypothetical protein ME1_00557 [Bartonella vinsonii subsp. arupensis OK-94-513]EJF98084.1 hypothetical protein MEI_00944 [Bartonella vinsonii subsp. arupensis Pm136co]